MLLSTFTLANPWWLLALPLVIALVILAGRSGLTSSITFSSLSILGSLARKAKRRPLGIHPTFWLFSMLLAVLACTRPQIVKSFETTKHNGIDIVIALDLSYSMTIEDFFPNDDRSKRAMQRLDAAKGVLRTFIAERANDRIGIVAFSGRPYTLSPITLDHNWLLKRLDVVDSGTIKEQGTAIGSAIAASSTRLVNRDAKSKVLILITDGANNSGALDPVEAAELSADLSVKIYTIAIGTEEGRVPSTIQRYPKQEFDIPTLKKIASTTGGEFFRARSVSDLDKTFNNINELEKSTVEMLSSTIAEELFPWLVGGSALFALLSLVYRIISPFSIP